MLPSLRKPQRLLIPRGRGHPAHGAAAACRVPPAPPGAKGGYGWAFAWHCWDVGRQAALGYLRVHRRAGHRPVPQFPFVKQSFIRLCRGVLGQAAALPWQLQSPAGGSPSRVCRQCCSTAGHTVLGHACALQGPYSQRRGAGGCLPSEGRAPQVGCIPCSSPLRLGCPPVGWDDVWGAVRELYVVIAEAPWGAVPVQTAAELCKAAGCARRKAGMDGVGVRAAIAYHALSGNMKLYCMTSRGRLNRYANSSRARALTS